MFVKLHECDAQEVKNLYAKSIAENPQGFIQDLSFHGCIVKMFAKFSTTGGDVCMLKDEITGQLLGMGALRQVSDDKAELCKLHLNSAYHGKGYGKKMALQLIEQARQKGFKVVELHVTTSQKPAIGLYEKLGFEALKCEGCTVTVAGEEQLYETLFMEKQL